MRTLCKLSLLSLAGLSLSLLGATANAQTSGPFTYTVAQATTDFTNTSIVLPQFDPSLGTLLSVNLSEALSGNFGGTVTNTSATPANFRVTEDVNLNLSITNTATPVLTAGGVDLIAQQNYTGLGSGATANFGPFAPSVSDSATYTSGSIFNQFIGPGNLGFTLATLTGTTTAGGGGNIQNNITTTAGGTITVVYQYRQNAVPEPGSVALLVGMGVTGAGLLRKRHLARKSA